MKRIIITMFMAAFLLVSCSDAYEIEQKGYVTDEGTIFNKPDDFEKAINALYIRFPGEDEIEFTSYFTDELGIGKNNAGQGVNDGSYTFALLAGNETATKIWGRHYAVINSINRMLPRIDELMKSLSESIPEEKDVLEQYKAHKAHLYGLRAYCHYKLFIYFTPDYTNPNGLSVMKFDFMQTSDYNRFEKRSTVSEIVELIEKDIKAAKTLGGITTGRGTGYASNAFLEAILIKLYSTLQTPDAYNELEEAFNRLVAEGKRLGSVQEYASMFSGNGEGEETIFKLNRVSSDNIDDKGVQSGIAGAWYANNVSPDEIVYMEMGRSLYNELDKLDPSYEGKPLHDFDDKGEIVNTYERKDARYVLSVLIGSHVAVNYKGMTAEDFKLKDLLFIGKYPGIENRPLMNDVFIFRFTDMLLALAEKRAFEGNLTGNVALDDFSNVESIIYNIRANRNMDESMTPLSMPSNFSSAKECYARILEERRIDFAFEGARYLDMKRLGKKAGSPGFVRDSQDCASTGACSLDINSTKLTLPIPRSEMMANPNMVQNPGY